MSAQGITGWGTVRGGGSNYISHVVRQSCRLSALQADGHQSTQHAQPMSRMLLKVAAFRHVAQRSYGTRDCAVYCT